MAYTEKWRRSDVVEKLIRSEGVKDAIKSYVLYNTTNNTFSTLSTLKQSHFLPFLQIIIAGQR
jgi:hypothetical protein